MSDQHKLKDLSKFLQAMLAAGDGDFSVVFTLKKNGTVHDFTMVAIQPAPKDAKWTGRRLSSAPPKE